MSPLPPFADCRFAFNVLYLKNTCTIQLNGLVSNNLRFKDERSFVFLPLGLLVPPIGLDHIVPNTLVRLAGFGQLKGRGEST